MSISVENFLQAVGEKILLEVSETELCSKDGSGFEKLVFEFCLSLNASGNYGFLIRETKKQAFPDIIINRTGVEVKSTVKDHWTTTGNSIQESQRDPDADKILFFFGKLGGTPSFLVRPYEDCLKNVVVTHNPRYLVDMTLGPGETIFSKMSLSYDSFRELDQPMAEVRKFVKKGLKPGETLWWMDQDNEVTKDLVLRGYSNLSEQEKAQFEISAMALCPEMFGVSTSKYERVPEILLTQFRAVSPNIRDKFSAGGKATLPIGAESFEVRSIDAKLYKNAREINKLINSAEPENLMEYWKVTSVPENRTIFFSDLLNDHTQRVVGPMLVGDIFIAGL